ncbi:unnamed protein product [Pocillopora meandrina]|uniref:Uncharacterized protein n=1 Tax=Pocillopora meandrina TaxID=46732 RepID=A0AAU9XS22_9CNID|nr:unnamed protein product [Pocillopora meandrina]
MREDNEIAQGDVTFNDVFRDFSYMASRDPDRLKRNFDASGPSRQTQL